MRLFIDSLARENRGDELFLCVDKYKKMKEWDVCLCALVMSLLPFNCSFR